MLSEELCKEDIYTSIHIEVRMMRH
ncbi:MAG: hypothetical protein ACLSXY_06540 [Veillonella sp.]